MLQVLQDMLQRWLLFWEWSLSISDPRTKDWLFMDSPWTTLQLTAVYLLVVLFGPKVMRTRKPIDSKALLFAYNIGLVLLNLYIFLQILVGSARAGYSYTCQKCVYSADPNEMMVANGLWWFYFSKLIEFLDTVFFIIRKKNSQISFLHVYHHATMFPIWWVGVKWAAGGQAFFGAQMNSFVHILMYSYYGLSALGPEVQKYLWWKRYLTKIQLIQFILGMVHASQSIYFGCDFVLWMQWALVFYAFTIFCLFLNFYIQSYLRPSRKETVHHGRSIKSTSNRSCGIGQESSHTSNGPSAARPKSD